MPDIQEISQQKQVEGFGIPNHEGNGKPGNPVVKLNSVDERCPVELNEMEEAGKKFVEEEANFRQLVQSCPDAIIVHKEGMIVFINPTGVKLLGATDPEQLIGQPIIDFIYPEHRSGGNKPGQGMNIKIMDNVPVEQRLVRLDGTEVDVEVSEVSFYQQGKRVVQLVVRDITARKQAEAMWQQQGQHFQTLIENTSDIIAVIDLDGHFRYSNTSMVRVLGYQPEQINGKHVDEFAHPDDVAVINEIISQTLQYPSASIPIAACRFRHRNGTWRIFAVNISNLLDDPAVAGFLLNCHDMTEDKQLEVELVQRNRELTILQSAGATIASSLDLHHVLEAVGQEMAKLLGLENCTIFELSQKAATIHPVAAYGSKLASDSLVGPYSLDDPLIQQVLMEQSPKQVTVSQLYIDPTAFKAMQAANIKTRLILPILYHGRIVGLAELDDTQTERTFTYQEISLAQLLANQAANAIENARLYEELRNSIDELIALNEIGHAVTSTLDLQEMLVIITNRIIQMLNVAAVSIALYDGARDDLWFVTAGGACADSVKGRRLAKDQGIVGWVFQNGESQIIPNVSDDPRFLADFDRESGFTTRSILCVPLQTKGQIIGAIEAINKIDGHFDQEDLRLFDSLAVSAAAAIENAQLYQQLAQERTQLAERVEEKTAELSRANAELARVARLKDEFLAGMSHELRTPLNAILGFAEILQDQAFGALNEKQLWYAHRIEEGGRHLLSLINDILDLSKIEAGKMELRIGSVAVESLCQASLRIIKELAHKKQLDLSIALDDADTIILADERRLKQILVNLLSNAVKFTPEGGQVGLEVKRDVARQVIHFTVWDTGIGIAQEDMDRLFQPFVQLDSRLSRQYAGTGLGLSLVFRMVEMHGGSISVDSEVGKGSRFTILLPWSGTLETVKPVNGNETTAINQPVVPLTSKQKSDQVSILLAEDNEDNIKVLLDYLRVHGYRVIVARNGWEAIEQTKNERPDLILMDIQMPEMDGLEAIRRLRAEIKLTTTPIIALTALAMPGDRERCLAAGANQYLSKPISPGRLIKTIETYLN